MTCALCKEKEANKKNTHYLTDGIIRSCINFEGSQGREKGFYFDISTNNPFSNLHIQRETPTEKTEIVIGRKVTDEESEKSKAEPNAGAVDNVFCSDCESHFTEIETKFMNKILPKFRGADLTGIDRTFLSDIITVRLFFYLQIWRSSVCRDDVTLSPNTSENLRKIILNYNNTKNADELTQYPLAVTYLQTLGGAAEYTRNYVGYRGGALALI